MIKNVSTLDRMIRGAIAVLALILAFVAGIGSVLGVVLLIVAVIAAGTAAAGTCLLYRALGINTNRSGSTTSGSDSPAAS